ncbi:GIY-YIG nuclease family protein [Flavitalea antarctica]
MPYPVYILQSRQLNKFYVGHTADLIEQRLRRHFSDHDGFTSKAKDWQLVYQEFFGDKKSAAPACVKSKVGKALDESQH